MLEFYPNHHHPHTHFHQQHPLIKDEIGNSILGQGKLSPGLDCVDKEIGVKCEKNFEICEGCGQKIYDRFLMRVANASYHEQCLKCSVCTSNLNHSCYSRNSKLYCKGDYDRIFSVKCSRCSERVIPQDMVMRVQHHVYHLPCFNCSVCCRPLEKGEQYFMNGGQLYCHLHYDPSSFYSTAPSSYGGGGPGSVIDDMDDDMLDDGLCSIRTRDGRRGPKRPRTILTSVQRRQFKASFEVSPKPCRKVREALAKDTGLSVRVVQVWFQNQRAKMKKIQRKAKHSDSADKGDKDGEDEKGIKQEHGEGYMGLDSSFGSSSGGQPINPNNPYSPDGDYPANSNDSFCSSELSLDGSSFGQMDEATSDTFQTLGIDHQQQSHGPRNSSSCGTYINPNPIDKLYLMQDSYFSGE